MLPSLCAAQQNLFNVPSAEVTSEGDFFFQQQFNLSKIAASNTTIDYGLGNNFEIGANVFLDSDTGEDNTDTTNPTILGNALKVFSVTRSYQVGIGTQTGFSPNTRNGSVALSEFSYLMNAFDLEALGKFYVGGYLANSTYGSGSNPGGVMVGLDYPVFPEKLDIIADLLTGDGTMSVAVVGMCAQVTKRWQLSVGAQLPAPDSHNDYGVVVEFTRLR